MNIYIYVPYHLQYILPARNALNGLTCACNIVVPCSSVWVMPNTAISAVRVHHQQISISPWPLALSFLVVIDHWRGGQDPFSKIFHRIGPLGRFGLVVAMSVCLSVCVCPSHAIFFKCYCQKDSDVECCYSLILINSWERNHHYLLQETVRTVIRPSPKGRPLQEGPL